MSCQLSNWTVLIIPLCWRQITVKHLEYEFCLWQTGGWKKFWAVATSFPMGDISETENTKEKSLHHCCSMCTAQYLHWGRWWFQWIPIRRYWWLQKCSTNATNQQTSRNPCRIIEMAVFDPGDPKALMTHHHCLVWTHANSIHKGISTPHISETVIVMRTDSVTSL